MNGCCPGRKERATEHVSCWRTGRCSTCAGPHQSFFSRLRRGDGQIFSLGVVGVDLHAVVALRLTQPSLQQRLDVHALPGRRPGRVRVDLQGSDPHPGAVSLLSRLEAGNLEEDVGEGVGGAQVNPQQSPQDVLGLDLWTQAEQAAGGQLVLADGIGCKQSAKGQKVRR